MENMYDILEKFNIVADRQTLTEGHAVREAKKAKPDFLDMDGDGNKKEPMKKAIKDRVKKKPVEETKKAKPDFLDMDGDGNKKEPMKKAIKDRVKKKPVKENIHVIRQVEFRGRQGRILHDREYDEYQVCVETDQGIRRAFTDNRDSANQLLENLMRERRTGKDKPFFPKPGADDEKTAFRKKFAPSVMRDPAAKGEVEKLDRDLERLKKMRRGELDPDEMGDEPPAGEKRGRGRPKKYTADRPRQERVTAKARKADRTAWTPDRKKKKMKEQDMAEGQKLPVDLESINDSFDEMMEQGADYVQAVLMLADEYNLDPRIIDKLLREQPDGEFLPQLGPNDLVEAYGDAVKKVFKRDGRPVGEVGIDPYGIGSPDATTWYIKHYASGTDLGGYDSYAEAVGELRHLIRQGVSEDYDQDEYDEEGEMAQSQASTIADAAEELQSMLDADENLPEWVQKKITLAKEYIDSARDYLKANRPEGGDMAMAEASTGNYSAKKARAGRDIGKPGKQFAKIAQSAGERYGSKERGEKVAGAVLAKLRKGTKESAGEDREMAMEKMASQSQNRLMRATAAGADTGVSQEVAREFIRKSHGQKVGDLPEKVREVDTGEAGARRTSPSSKEHNEKVFAKSRERSKKEREEHDTQQKEKSVKETTTAGSVATAPTEGGTKSKGGIQFGKGVYEARLAEQFEREMKSVMNEGLDVSVTANADGSNTVSVTGKDVAPDVLMDLLQMAGMSGSREEVYQPVQMAPDGADSMSGMLDTLDGLAGGDDVGQPEPMIPEATVCEVCGGHEGMHEAGCEREMALEADLANSADNTETMSMDYMVDELAGGVNGPKLQSNPNNPGDNPLAMPGLGRQASPNLNLGAVVEQVQQETENRLLDLYRKIGK